MYVSPIMLTLFSGGVLATSLLFIYNVYKFWETLPRHCDCADKIQKYFLYAEAVYYGVSVSLALLATFLMSSMAFRS
jgi:hypothetical protein